MSLICGFLQAANHTANFTGELAFLNSFSYGLGYEILVPVGQQELFDSGVLHYYDYGHLYNTSTKIIARTTTVSIFWSNVSFM